MAKIKIISNPYQKKTSFQIWEETAGQWQDIDPVQNANSKLLSNELTSGFFPFKVKQIVDVIIAEYCTGTEHVEIVFEGTDDEYLELESICREDDYALAVRAAKSTRYLENARDILPDVIDIFREIKPLVSESVSDKDKIKRGLDKFSDASNDIIPICVVGNYSSGKSTFINALIGYELLPSSDEPTTAKIYKISQSKYMDRASIHFECHGKDVRLRFSDHDYKFLTDPGDTALAEKLKAALDEISEERIPIKLSRVLEIVNTYANRVSAEEVSDLIELETPFDEDGLWGNIHNRFVIFDTPGSNSASNIKHYQVLKKAIENLSNGLPIFVSEYDSLDSTDNDRLYQDINGMEELDNRFTMIIVNKADTASLKKGGHTADDRERILSLAIPRKLYSGGIYFVSSIMGLGAKNDEIFLDDHNAEVFEDQRNKYADPGSRFYRQLYRYNIMPEQIRKRYSERASQHKNRIYANSGLYSVEQAIETFAGVYSSYNKCHQSQMFLGEVIQTTMDEIETAKEERAAHRDRINANLEKEKHALIEKLKDLSGSLNRTFVQDYFSEMSTAVDGAKDQFNAAELREQEERFRADKAEEYDADGRRGNIGDSLEKLRLGFVDNVLNVFRTADPSSLQKIYTSLSSDIKDVKDTVVQWQETRRDVESAASDELIHYTRDAFLYHIGEARKQIESASREYWARRTEQFKQALSELVTNSTALTDQERSKLAGVIIEYQELAFESNAEKIFDKTDFLRIFGDPNRLNTGKLARRYNNAMREHVEEIYQKFQASHTASFHQWADNLMNTIERNIEEFNPELHTQAEIIRVENERIADLEARRIRLDSYTAQIRRMMDWKEE